MLPNDEIAVEADEPALAVTPVNIIELSDTVADNVLECFLYAGKTDIDVIAERIQVVMDAPKSLLRTPAVLLWRRLRDA